MNVLNGQNVLIFAYGPTGTGKTFTMLGDNTHANRGLIPWSIEQIFKWIQLQNTQKQLSVYLDV